MDEFIKNNDWASQSVSLEEIIVQLVVGIILSTLIRWHFSRFGSVYSNRDEVGYIFPFILLTTLLVINVVKSSLALSLGLVGALSIVRFRTPIKEPEELAYLFLSIACGLGLGANQIGITVIVSLVILTYMVILKNKKNQAERKNLYLSISLSGNSEGGNIYDNISQIVAEHVEEIDLQRLESSQHGSDLTYFITIDNAGAASKLVSVLQGNYPDSTITFIDQPNIPGL